MGFRRRLLLLYLLGCAGMAAVWLRVAWLQVVSADHWQAAARRARERLVDLDARRGPIVDASGALLVEDAPVLQLALVPAEWKTRDRLRCDTCGTVHFRSSEGGRLPRCRCKAGPEHLEPLGPGDLAPLERALGLPPGHIAAAAARRQAAIDAHVEDFETRLRDEEGDDFLALERVRVYRDEKEQLPVALVAEVPEAAARLVALDEAGVTRGLLLRPWHRRTAAGAGVLARVLGRSSLPSPERLAQRLRLSPDDDIDLRTPLGVSGLEQRYDGDLRGRPGRERRARDEQGRFSIVVESEPPLGGSRLVLSASLASCAGAQRCLESLPDLEAHYAPRTRPSGALVLMNADTGEILALAELPAYDPDAAAAAAADLEREIVPLADLELGDWIPGRAVLGAPLPVPRRERLFARHQGFGRLTLPWRAHETRIVPWQRLPEGFDATAWRKGLCLPTGEELSRISQVPVEPGSTLKIFIGLAMLESGLPLPIQGDFVCEGRTRKPGCHNHGPVDFGGALCTSCNQYFAYSLRNFASHWPTYRTKVAEVLDRLGFGHATAGDIEGEARGRWLRAEEWGPDEQPKIHPDGAQNLAIGQGDVVATPLQMVRAVAVLANGGRLVTPHLGARLESPDGGSRTPAFPVQDLGFSPENIARVRDAMERVVYEPGGTAYGKYDWGTVPARVYGKTGTSQTGRAWHPFHGDQQNTDVTHHWFVGFAEPDHGPRLAFAVVYHAREEKAAGVTAAKTAGALLAWWLGR